jgi:hypothetical protein
MIDRQHGKYLVECETCDEVLETGTGDFDEAREVMRHEGWKARRRGDAWLHGCPKCGAPK